MCFVCANYCLLDSKTTLLRITVLWRAVRRVKLLHFIAAFECAF